MCNLLQKLLITQVSSVSFLGNLHTLRLRMLSSANEPLQIRSRLHFSQCSQPTPSQALNNAFGNCNLTDNSQFALQSQLGCSSDVSMSQQMSQSQTQNSTHENGRTGGSMQPPSSQAYGLGYDNLTSMSFKVVLPSEEHLSFFLVAQFSKPPSCSSTSLHRLSYYNWQVTLRACDAPLS